MSNQSSLFNEIKSNSEIKKESFLQKRSHAEVPMKSFPKLSIESGLLKENINQDGVFWIRILLNQKMRQKNHNFVESLRKEILIKKGILPLDLIVQDFLIHL
jgi:hypothetical protein